MNLKFSIYLTAILLFYGCNEKSNKSELTQSNEPKIEINKIEKNITHKNSSVGCKGSKEKECSQKESIDSADFILNALDREEKKNRLKEGLEHLVEKSNRRKQIKDKIDTIVNSASVDIDNIHEKKIATPPDVSKDVKRIKESLEELVESTNHSKSVKIKQEIEKLIEKSVDKENIKNTKKRLEYLVEEIESNKDSKLTNMAEALIDDIATKKVDIIKETDKYFLIRVKKGDSLSLLAQRYYRDSKKFKIIYEANRDKLNSSYELYPNMILKIPKI
jgi:hypothetical protein